MFLDPERAGWFQSLKKTADKRRAKEDGGDGPCDFRNKRERYAIGKINHDIQPFTKRILDKYDFRTGDDSVLKIATIKLRKTLMAYFGVDDYRKYVASATVARNGEGNVTVEVGYSRDVWKSDNVSKWSIVDARREFNSKD